MSRLGLWLLAVTLLGVPAAQAADFTIAIIGDTQGYSQGGDIVILQHMVDWLNANASSQDIELVIQVGDVIQSGFEGLTTPVTTEEWARFNSAWHDLNLPYVIVRGNHDNPQEFALHYGPAHWTALEQLLPGYTHLETFPGDDDDANAWIIELGGQDVLVLGLSCGVRQPELDWAQAKMEANPGLPAILVSHIITWLNGIHMLSDWNDNCRGLPPKSIWDELVVPNVPQVFMTASGHWTNKVGYRGIRELDGSAVLDTYTDYQKDRAGGCIALARFRGALREVEVDTFCVELDGGVGAYVDDPPTQTLPTAVLDDACMAIFSLFHGTQLPSYCVEPPGEALTVSFRDTAQVPNQLSAGPFNLTAGSLLNLGSFRILDASEIVGSIQLDAQEIFSGIEDLDAAHALLDGRFIFSTVTTVEIDGNSYAGTDLVLYDPVTGSASLFFDSATFPGSQLPNIDAFYLFEATSPFAGTYLLSTELPASLGSLVFRPGDVVRYDPVADVATLYFNQDLIAGTAAQKNVDAVHLLSDGHLVLSTRASNGSLGGLTLKDEDLVEYDPVADTAMVLVNGAGLFNGVTAGLNAATLSVPGQVQAQSPLAAPALGGLALGSLAAALGCALVQRGRTRRSR